MQTAIVSVLRHVKFLSPLFPFSRKNYLHSCKFNKCTFNQSHGTRLKISAVYRRSRSVCLFIFRFNSFLLFLSSLVPIFIHLFHSSPLFAEFASLSVSFFFLLHLPFFSFCFSEGMRRRAKEAHSFHIDIPTNFYLVSVWKKWIFWIDWDSNQGLCNVVCDAFTN